MEWGFGVHGMVWGELGIHPFVLPLFVLGCLGVLAVAGFDLWLRRAWGQPRYTSWAVLFWVSVVGFVSLTLTPSIGGPPPSYGACLWDVESSLGLFAADPERRWNTLLCVPIGLGAVGYATAALRARCPDVPAFAAPVLAPLLPWVVEGLQRYVPGLHRVCALQDVVDNVTGILLGYLLAGVFVTVGVALRGRESSGARSATPQDAVRWRQYPG